MKIWKYIIPWLYVYYVLTLGFYMKFQKFQKKARLAIRSFEPRGPGTGPGSPVKGLWICRDIPFLTTNFHGLAVMDFHTSYEGDGIKLS